MLVGDFGKNIRYTLEKFIEQCLFLIQETSNLQDFDPPRRERQCSAKASGNLFLVGPWTHEAHGAYKGPYKAPWAQRALSLRGPLWTPTAGTLWTHGVQGVFVIRRVRRVAFVASRSARDAFGVSRVRQVACVAVVFIAIQ